MNTSTTTTTKVSKKQMIEMNTTASAIKGVLDNLRMQLGLLDDEIRADEKSKAEYDRHLAVLQRQKEELLKRVDENAAWSKNYDTDVGPFAAK
jgi:chromosome segregation ATPase